MCNLPSKTIAGFKSEVLVLGAISGKEVHLLRTDKTLENLPSKGIKNLLVICPGFASDCVETLEEIDIQGREIFLRSGGKNFDLIFIFSALILLISG